LKGRGRILPNFLSAYGLFARRNATVSEVLVSALSVAGAIFDNRKAPKSMNPVGRHEM